MFVVVNLAMMAVEIVMWHSDDIVIVLMIVLNDGNGKNKYYIVIADVD